MVLVSQLQSTLVISKLKGLSETLRDIRTSTYQIFRIEENTNRTTKFHNCIHAISCELKSVRSDKILSEI